MLMDLGVPSTSCLSVNLYYKPASVTLFLDLGPSSNDQGLANEQAAVIVLDCQDTHAAVLTATRTYTDRSHGRGQEECFL